MAYGDYNVTNNIISNAAINGYGYGKSGGAQVGTEGLSFQGQPKETQSTQTGQQNGSFWSKLVGDWGASNKDGMSPNSHVIGCGDLCDYYA